MSIYIWLWVYIYIYIYIWVYESKSSFIPVVSNEHSLDAMAVQYERGEVADLLGCLEAAEYYEVIVYDDQGDDLSFLLHVKPDGKTPIKTLGFPPSNQVYELSGAERLQMVAAV